MSVEQIVFIVISAIAVGGAFGVVAVRNLFHSALFLVLSFAGVAGLYVLLDAGFIAAVQVLIYIGAISILILFAVMLSQNLMARDERQNQRRWRLGAALAFALTAALVVMLVRASNAMAVGNAPMVSIEQLGTALVGPFALPFEVASGLLLVALVGAILLAREEE